MALPITAVQILWINLITAVTLGLALAFEPSEPGTMRRPPRPRDEPLLTGALDLAHRARLGPVPRRRSSASTSTPSTGAIATALAQTMAMNTLVVLEIFHLFFIRNIHGTSLTWAAARGTPVVWACVVDRHRRAVRHHLSAAAAGRLRDAAPVPLRDGMLIVAIGAVFFALIETEKQMRLAFRRPRST